MSTLIEKFTPGDSRLIAGMRRSIRKRLPASIEVIYEYRDCFVISFSPSEHGYEGVLAIRGSAEAVRLYFHQGKDLPDPEELLQGKAKSRYIEIKKASTLSDPAVVQLIDHAIKSSSVPFALAGKGAVLLRSTAPKKRVRQKG